MLILGAYRPLNFTTIMRNTPIRLSWLATRPDGAGTSWPKGLPVTTNRPTGQTRPRQTRSRQRVRPLPQGTSLFTPGASPARQATERRSARTLIYLHQLPRWMAPVLLVVFLIAGLALHGPVGAVALCLVAAVLAWLAALSWPRLSAGGRMGRVLAVAFMLALAGYQAIR
jgi:hypothetical protein